MRVLRNHIILEFFSPFLFSIGAFILLFLLGRGLVQMADFIFNKSVNIFLVLKLLWYSLPFVLTFIIPMSVLIGTLSLFGKLSYDNEIMAMRASGISLLKIAKPLFFTVVVLSLLTLILSDQLASSTHYRYRVLLKRIGIENPAAALEEGTFIKKFKNFVIFIYEIDKNKLKGIRIYQPQEGRPTRTITAQKGELISLPEEGIIKLRLIQGTSDEPDAKDPAKFYTINFKTYDFPLNLSDIKETEKLGKKPKDMSIRELRNEIESLGEEGIKATYPLSAEIHNKVALALSSISFLLIGIPLGITTRRSHRSVSFVISLLLMTAYWMLLIGGKALAQKGLVHPFLGLQFSNLVIGGIGLFLLNKTVKT